MESENNGAAEITEADFATFDEGWGNEPAGETAGGDAGETVEGESGTSESVQPPAGGESAGDGQSTAEGENTASAAEGKNAETGTAADEGEQPPAGGTAESFDLNINGQVRTVGRDEVIRLAQDGAGRVEAERQLTAFRGEIDGLGGMDAVRDVMGVVRELAETSGMTTEQFVDNTRATMISRRDNIGMDLALERAKTERLQRASDERTRQDDARKAAENKRNEDFMAFMRAYPEVKAADIPKEVWDAARRGESLLTAYAMYEAREARAETEKLRAEAEAAKKNFENRQKAGPGARSAGVAAARRDAFDEGWDDLI